jgi:hypothetical protein
MKLEGKSLWTYLAYLLSKIFKTKNKITFQELEEINNILHKECHLFIWCTREELLYDLQYLKKIKAVKFEEKENLKEMEIMGNIEQLREIANVVTKSPFITGSDLLKEYRERIDKGIEIFLHPT